MDKAATFNCNECEKTFSRNDNLNRHIKRVHEKLKSHRCAICSKSFSRKQHRDYHLRTCSRYVSLPTERTERITKKKFHQLEFTPIQRSSSFRGIATVVQCIYAVLCRQTGKIATKDVLTDFVNIDFHLSHSESSTKIAHGKGGK